MEPEPAACRQSVRSDSQDLTAAATTGCQYTTAILGVHTRTEAVHLAALTLLGLVSTEHGQHSSRFHQTVIPLGAKNSLHSIHKRERLVKQGIQIKEHMIGISFF